MNLYDDNLFVLRRFLKRPLLHTLR
jgi:hypothetical protein